MNTLKISAYAVFDEKAGVYDKPFFVLSDGVAQRIFGDGVNQEDTQISKHPGDYKLYRVGGFDLESGILYGLDEPPKFLAHGSDFIEPVALREVNNG